MRGKIIFTKGQYRIEEEYDPSDGLYTQHVYKGGEEVNTNVQSYPMSKAEAAQHIAEYEMLFGR